MTGPSAPVSRLRRLAPAALFLLAGCAGQPEPQSGTFPVYDLPTRQTTERAPVPQPPGRGTLVLDGGGYANRAILDEIVTHAGPDPTLCLVDTADADSFDLRRLFRGYDGLQLRALDLDVGDVDRPEVVDLLRSCSGYYFGGGAPKRLSDAFVPGGRESLALAAIRERVETHGAVLSGASAGAMIVSPITLCECGQQSSVAALKSGTLFQAPGFGLVEDMLVDAHFFARGLLGRHLYALARNDVPLGVGIDEETAVVIPGDGSPWTVVGERGIAVIEAPPTATAENLRDFTISLLAPGDRFDPATRTVIVAPERQRTSLTADATAAAVVNNIFAPNRVPDLMIHLARNPMTEGVGYAADRTIRVTFRKTDATEIYSNGSTYSILRMAVSVDRS